MFDSDEAGKEGAIALASKIGIWKCSLVELPFKDANKCLQEGVSPETIHNCIEDDIELTPATLLTANDFSSKTKHLFEMGDKIFGLPTPWRELDNLLKGWRGGEVTLWTGKNSAGKSTILNQVILELAKLGEKSCIYSGEMPPERYLRWAVIQYTAKDHPDPREIDAALNYMTNKIYILGMSSSIEVNKLLNDFEYAVRRYGVRHFVIDSLMKINLGVASEKEEYQAQKNFMNILCDFAKKFNVHIHLVAHPRKSEKDTDQPGKVDVKGSSHLTDLAHNVIVIYRNTEEQKDKAKKKGITMHESVLYVKKNREFGFEGWIDLWFNSDTKTFST
jgi:twinkle protein